MQKILLILHRYYLLWKKPVACVVEYFHTILLDVVCDVDDSIVETVSLSLGIGMFLDMPPYV